MPRPHPRPRRASPGVAFAALKDRTYGSLVVVADGGQRPAAPGSLRRKRAVYCDCRACGRSRRLAYLDALESGNTRTCGCAAARARAEFAAASRARRAPPAAGVE